MSTPCDYHVCAQCANFPDERGIGAWAHWTTRGHRIQLVGVKAAILDYTPDAMRHLAKALLDAADHAVAMDWENRNGAPTPLPGCTTPSGQDRAFGVGK